MRMTNYREVLRLGDLRIKKQGIASACECSRNTVAGALRRTTECGLSWEQVQDWNNKELSENLFPAAATSAGNAKLFN
jgi:hypothetical protein